MGTGNERRIIELRPPRLTNAASSRVADFERAAQQLMKENPGADFGVVERFLTDYRKVEEEISSKAVAFNVENRQRAAANQPPLDPRALPAAASKFRNGFMNAFDKTVTANERPLWEKYARKMQAPSLIGAATSQFYDSDKGLSIPGLLGGAVAAYFVFNQMGGMPAGWLAVGAGLLAAIAGAWLTNQAVGKVSSLMNGEHKPSPEPVKSRSRQRGFVPDGPASSPELTPQHDPDDRPLTRATPQHMGQLVESVIRTHGPQQQYESAPATLATNQSPTNLPILGDDKKTKPVGPTPSL